MRPLLTRTEEVIADVEQGEYGTILRFHGIDLRNGDSIVTHITPEGRTEGIATIIRQGSIRRTWLRLRGRQRPPVLVSTTGSGYTREGHHDGERT